MNSNFVKKGMPDDIFMDNYKGEVAVKTEDTLNQSSPTTIIGNVTSQQLLTPTNGDRIVVKAMIILAEGNTGTVKIERSSDGATILPCYVTVHNHASTSSALNLVLESGESISVTTEGRGATDESFIGISYLEIQ